MKYTFENTYVNRLDLVKMAEDLRENFEEDIKINGFGGLILKPKIALIDTEIVCRPLGKEAHFKIDIFKADKVTETGRSIAMFPSWTVDITPDELQKYVIESMPLSEYLKGRRGYNGRLETNEHLVIKWLNQKEKQPK